MLSPGIREASDHARDRTSNSRRGLKDCTHNPCGSGGRSTGSESGSGVQGRTVYHGKDLWGRHVPAGVAEAVLHAVLLGNANPCALPIIYDIEFLRILNKSSDIKYII